MAEIFTWFIRFLHIFSAVMWVGGIFLWGMLVAPGLTKRLPLQPGGLAFGDLYPRYVRYSVLAGVLTVVTGLWTMGLIVGWSNYFAAFQGSTYGIALGVSLVLALAMLALGFGVLVPAVEKLRNAVGTTGPETAELRRKVMMAGMTNMLLGTLALAAMAMAANWGP